MATIVEGQMQGSIAFGIGPALTEAVKYDDNGRLLTRDFRTYGLLEQGNHQAHPE